MVPRLWGLFERRVCHHPRCKCEWHRLYPAMAFYKPQAERIFQPILKRKPQVKLRPVAHSYIPYFR
jgi:hypothetical protein